MASKFLTNIDLNQNELINASFQVVGTLPTTDNFEGRMVFSSAEDTIFVYGNGAWRKIIANISPTVAAVVAGGTHATSLTITESGGQITITPNLADTDEAGLLSSTFWNDLTDATSDATASKLVKRDANGNIKVATPTDAAHAATKGYVDAARQGLDVKKSVRAATTVAVNLTSELEAGDTIDTNVTLVAGDRVLVKNQGTASQNGIYVVQSSGAAVRATDANGTADTGEVSGGTFTFVEEGAVNADSGWVVSTNGAITVGTDAMNWVQFSGAGQVIAGDGLSKDGNTLNVNVVTDRTAITSDAVDIAATYVGQTSITTLGTITTGTWNGTDVAIADGGTGSGTASGARTNLAETSASGLTTSTPVLARISKQGCAASTGSPAISTTTVTHNFGTTDVMVQIYEVASGATVFGDVSRSNGNTISVVLNGAISANDYTIVVTG
jgi:hypothetical protein